MDTPYIHILARGSRKQFVVFIQDTADRKHFYFQLNFGETCLRIKGATTYITSQLTTSSVIGNQPYMKLNFKFKSNQRREECLYI